MCKRLGGGILGVNSKPVDADLVDLIGRIYDCVIDPSRWYDTVDRLRLHFGFHNAGLGVIALPSGDNVLQVAVNFPPGMVELAQSHGEYILELWGGPARAARAALEEPVLQSLASNTSTWPENAYFRAFAMPQGLVDSIALPLARDSTTIATLGLGVHHTAKPPGEAVFDGLRIIAPHLRRAVIISRMLRVSAAATQSFAAALDASSAGVVLVDGSLRIVHANAAAQAMLAAGDPVRDTQGRLELPGEMAPGVLGNAVASAERGDAALGQKGTGIPARRRDGSPLTLQVMPPGGRRGGPEDLGAVAAIFIADSSHGAPPPAGLLSILFDLTPAEARIFELVAAGRSSAQIADELTIAPSTFKSHLERVYLKTGRNSRSGLVRLASEVSPPR